MADYILYLNYTAPYANGLGRRTLLRLKARVDAVSTETALMSDNLQTVGKVVVHDEHYAIVVLGKGIELHIFCPGDVPHCKACGAPRGRTPNFCRDCVPRPALADEWGGDELLPRSEKLAQGKLKPIAARDTPRARGRGRKTLPTAPANVEKLARQLQEEFEW